MARPSHDNCVEAVERYHGAGPDAPTRYAERETTQQVPVDYSSSDLKQHNLATPRSQLGRAAWEMVGSLIRLRFQSCKELLQGLQ